MSMAHMCVCVCVCSQIGVQGVTVIGWLPTDVGSDGSSSVGFKPTASQSASQPACQPASQPFSEGMCPHLSTTPATMASKVGV
jgi:hypothetical protein